jgi:hypothetical protein
VFTLRSCPAWAPFRSPRRIPAAKEGHTPQRSLRGSACALTGKSGAQRWNLVRTGIGYHP